MATTMRRSTSPKANRSILHQKSEKGLTKREEQQFSVRKSESLLSGGVAQSGLTWTENSSGRRTSGDKCASEWRQRSNDRATRKGSEVDLRSPSQQESTPRSTKPIGSPLQMRRKISQGSIDIAPRKSQTFDLSSSHSGEKGGSEWHQRSNDRATRKGSESDLRNARQQESSPRASRPIPSPPQKWRSVSQGTVDVAPRKSQTFEPAAANTSSIVCPSSSSEADIRCAAAVHLGKDCSVWCGERDGSLAIREPESFSVRKVLPQERLLSDYVWSILHDDGFVLVGMSSGRLRVYDAESQELLFERIRHAGGIYALACLGEFAYSASNDFTIMEWSRGSYEPTNRILGEHSNQVRCLCSCAGYLVSGGDDHVIHIWDLGCTIRTMCFQCDDSVLALTSVPGVSNAEETQGALVNRDILWAGDNKGDLTLYDLQANTGIGSIRGHSGAVSNLLYQDGFVLSSSVDKMVKVWNPLTRTCLQTFQAHASYVAGLLPVSIVTQVRLWSFGGDRKVRCWNMERVSSSDDELSRLKDERQHQARRVAQLTKDYASTKASLDSKESDVRQLTTCLQAKEAEWSAKDEQQREEIARLSAALAAREQEHEKTLRELEAARNSNHLLSQEKADLQCDLDRTRDECRSDLDRERRARQDAIANLAEATKQLRDRTVELQSLRERCDAAELLQAQSGQVIAGLQEKLAVALEAKNTAEKRIQSFEEQALVQEALRTSRLGFVTEVWALHLAIGRIKSSIQGSKSNLTSSGRGSAKINKNASEVANHDVQQSTSDIHRHSKHIIAKYLTDHEKLHLGAPLAHYEGGHDSPQPLDWSSISEITSTTDAASTTQSPDCSFSSDSSLPKAVKLQESQKRQPLPARIDASSTNRQTTFQPTRRNPRQTSPSSARS